MIDEELNQQHLLIQTFMSMKTYFVWLTDTTTERVLILQDLKL